MTHRRSWLALVALLAAIVGGTVWAAGQEKKTDEAAGCCAGKCAAKDKACCADSCCGTKEKDKTCCEGKCCAKEKAGSCCADGKCCGCCGKATQTATLPVPPGSAVQLMIAPPGSFPDAAYAPEWAGPAMAPVPAPPPCPPYAQYVAAPSAELLPPPVPCRTATAARHAFSPWRLSVVVLNDRARLAMRWDGDEETCAYCEDMVVQIDQEPLKVSVVDKQVRVSGSFVKGSADTVTRNTADGSLVLEGHVKMHYGKEGQKVEVAAEHVVVGIADGRVEVKGPGSAAHPRPSTAPVRCPACPTSSGECPRAFDFCTGFFR